MAKLIVIRPRLGRTWDARRSFDVLIDGQPAGAVGVGETIEIDLSPGRREVRLQCGRLGSRPVVVEPGPDETHRLAVGPNLNLHKRTGPAICLSMLPLLGLCAWINFGPRVGRFSAHLDWQIALVIPTAVLSFIPLLFVSIFSSNDLVVACKIPNADLTEQQVALLLWAHPFRKRITIRHVMIAVALLALAFGASLELFRSTRALSFRSRASFHADQEAMFRKFEQGWVEADLEMEKKGYGRGHFTKEAAEEAALADYHAAMKRQV